MRAAFTDYLESQYLRLFSEQEQAYALAMRKYTPRMLAERMVAGLADGSANKDGEGIKNTCKHFGIKYTYKAIKEFLATP